MRHPHRLVIFLLNMKPLILVLFWHTLNMTQRNLVTRAVTCGSVKRNRGKKNKMIGTLGIIVMTGILGNRENLYMAGAIGILGTLGLPGPAVATMKVQIGKVVEMTLNVTAGAVVAEEISGMTRTGKGTATMIGQMIDEMAQKTIGTSTGKEAGEVVSWKIGRGEMTTMMTEGVTEGMTSTRTEKETDGRS